MDAGAVDAGAVDAGAVDAGADAGPPTIAGVSWACSSLVTGTAGSDLWPITWSDDGNQYAAWGDGNGFASARYGYGISRLARFAVELHRSRARRLLLAATVGR